MAERPRGSDVAILGAGVVGCAIAYHLAKRRIVPVVLDQGGAGGATEAAAGRVWIHSGTPAEDGHLGLRSAERFPLLQEQLGPVEYLRTGGLDPALTEAEAEAGMALARTHAAAGLPVRWLSREEVLRREPALSPAILGATYSPRDGAVNPFLLVRRFILATRGLGGTFLLHAGHVTVRAHGGRFIVRSGHGETEARRLVLAAGAWAPAVARQLGFSVPVERSRRIVLVTETLPPLLRHTLAWARQRLTGEVLLEPAQGTAGQDSGPTLEAIRRAAERGTRLIPALAAARVIRAVPGECAVPRDGRPVVGRVEEEIYAAVVPRAITLCPLIGHAMAEMIAEGNLPDGLDPWSPARLRHALGAAGSAPPRQDSRHGP